MVWGLRGTLTETHTYSRKWHGMERRSGDGLLAEQPKATSRALTY